MTFQDILAVGASIIISVGGASAIILGLSSWLGKVWAQRIMDKERAAYEASLAELRSKLEHKNSREIEAIKTDLSIFKEQNLKGFHDKLVIYRLVVDVVVEILGDLDVWEMSDKQQKISLQRMDQINRARFKTYGYLGMLAPQGVMDVHDNLIEHLYDVIQGHKAYEWDEVRKSCLLFLNEIRKDVGLNTNPITYNGNR